jgi:sugar phosphate isomerase/epimerase
MKLSLSAMAFTPDQADAVRVLMRQHGFHGLEAVPARLHPQPDTLTDDLCARWRQPWAENGVQLCAMQSLLYGMPDCALFDTLAARERMRDNLTRALDAAHWLGVPTAVFGSGRQRRRGALSATNAEAVALPFFREIGDIAAARNVVFCLEAVATHYGSDFITSTAEAADWVERLDHPAVGLHADAAGLVLAGEDPTATIARYGHRLRHFHVSEPDLRPIGTGAVDHDAIARALRQADYRGWVSVEMLPPDGGLPVLADSLARVRDAYGD